MTDLPPHLVFVSMPLVKMALLPSSLTSSLCPSRLGGERDLLLTSATTSPVSSLPPSPGQPSPVPHFVLWGRGLLSPWPPSLLVAQSPRPHLGHLPLSLTSPSGWLLSPHSPCLSSPSLFCVSPPLSLAALPLIFSLGSFLHPWALSPG